MIGAAHAAFERAEKVFDVVRGEAILVDVFMTPMQQGFVTGKFLAEFRIETAFVANQNRLAADVLNEKSANNISTST